MTQMRKALMLVLAAAPVAAATAGDPASDLRLRTLAATCAQCHGTDGRAVPGGVVPGLAGRPESVLIEQMTAFKAGTTPATVMTQLAKGYSDAQIRQLASYFAGRPP